ncbi:MAG: hypothetical protein IJS81_09815 [Selenomonadaceae bacterium]|nr:hypothetical protein [Selenomonadaceae bacterium]
MKKMTSTYGNFPANSCNGVRTPNFSCKFLQNSCKIFFSLLIAICAKKMAGNFPAENKQVPKFVDVDAFQ